MHTELLVWLCSEQVGDIPNVRHHRISTPTSGHCSSEFVLMKKFICSWWMPVLRLLSAFPENTRALGKSSDMFLNASDLSLRSSKIISRKGGYQPSVYLLFCRADCPASRSCPLADSALLCVLIPPPPAPYCQAVSAQGAVGSIGQTPESKCVHEANLGKRSRSRLTSGFFFCFFL